MISINNIKMIKIKFIILRMKNNEKEKKDAKEITLKTFPDRPPEKTSEEKGQEFQKTKEKLKSFSNSININKNSLSSSDSPLSSALEETARVNACTRNSRGRPSYI
jgi:hypothetical protein